jgi:hypothetical protein
MHQVISSFILGGVLATLSAVGFAQSSLGGQSLQGAWNVTINPQGFPSCTAPSLNTGDGGVIANACDASESPGYGQWVRTGNREFTVTFIGLEIGVGTYKVRAKVTLSDDLQGFSGPFKTEVFAPNGSVLFTATGTVTAKRILVEPF